MYKSTNTPKVYIDTCIFLNVIKKEQGLWSESLKMLLAAERGDIRLVASTLLMIEIGSWNGEVDPLARDKVLSEYLENLSIEWVELDLFTAHEARKLCDLYHMRGADASHLATALRRKAEYFITRDKGFPKGQVAGSGLQVSPPLLLWNPTIEDAHIDILAEKEDATSTPRQRSG